MREPIPAGTLPAGCKDFNPLPLEQKIEQLALHQALPACGNGLFLLAGAGYAVSRKRVGAAVTPPKEGLMQKKWIVGGVAAACVVWTTLFFLARWNEEFRQSLPVPLLVVLGHDDGVRGGEWDDASSGESSRRPTPEHVIEVFSSDIAAVHAAEEDQAADSEEKQPDDATEATDETAETEEGDTDEPRVFEENPRYTVELDPERGEILHSEVLKGDSAGKLLAAWMNANDYTAALNAAKPLYSLTNIKAGHPFAVIRDPADGTFRAFRYEIDGDRILEIRRTEDVFSASIEKIDYTTELVRVHGAISTNLSEAVVGMGETVGLAIALADVFGSEINFITDLRVGDSFEVLVEKRSRDGVFKGYGRLLGARFTNKGKLHEAYMFPNEFGKSAYYNARGESLHRVLLKAPLSFLRVTSGYSMARRHPIYGQVRPHQGIDSGAPHGTPIMAVGDGVVSRAGRAGGYGKQVVIRHSGGLESMYGHMSRFARGIRPGVAVRQGQTIGYVGATGTATGPHLDFRIKQRGKFVNPHKLVVPRDRAVDRKRMKSFRSVVNAVNACWSGKDLSGYDPDTWFAPE